MVMENPKPDSRRIYIDYAGSCVVDSGEPALLCL
jgi:hypothetical protein